MIIGNGTIAKVLKDRDDRLYFASGVSNSKETRSTEYAREIALLLEQDHSKHIVYFSTLSIFYSDNRYALHKRMMEVLIKTYFKKYTIMRLGNPTWGTNINHLIPFFRYRIENEIEFEIQDVYRYPLELEEFLHWIEKIPEWSCEMNITGKIMKAKDIVRTYGHTKLHTK